MSGTALEHRLVRDYLTQLDVALGGLPSAKARELRSQIAGHLEEALSPDVNDEDVAAVLHQLGRPADLAREAQAGAAPEIGAAVAAAARRGWVRILRARLRTKLIVILIALSLAAGATFLSIFLSAPLPSNADVFGWWYPQDYNHEVDSTADGAQQTTVRIRSGQWQGFGIGIYNSSNFTETIIGPPTGEDAPWDSPNGGPQQPRIEVSAPNRALAHWGFIRNVAFESLPVSIPPHQYRLLRITWITSVCILGGTKSSNMLNDGFQSIDSISLRVRVGWLTRTDV
ncbi:MAG: hypothetical protein J2P28_21590, partial [Actinobacteria bacterium]|nr:hypothetical protein [Actinomycetota bacterium]